MAPKHQLRPFKRPEIKLYPAAHETGYIRTLPEVVELNARENPDHLFCLQAKKSLDSSIPTLIPVTNAQLRDAVARCAKWLRASLELQLLTVSEDGSIKKGAPVALLMESDVGLWIHEMALMGMGVPVLLISARLSATAVHSLLERTSACAILASRRLEPTAREAAAQAVPVHSPVSFEILLSQDPQTDLDPDPDTTICHPHHYIDESDRDVVILHSSGTTGLPKPIYVSHRHLISYVNNHRLDDDNESVAQGPNVSTLPLYHGFGYLAPALAMGVGKTVCFPPGSIVPSAGSTLDLLRISSASSLMTVPSILEDLSLLGKEEGIRPLAKLEFVAFGGGFLKPAVGTLLSRRGVRLLNHYGTTETGPLAPIFVPKDDSKGEGYDWRFFRLRDDFHLKLEEVAPHGDERRFKLTTFPFGLGGKPFEIQDELVCNPRHPETDFTAVGRTDDTIVLATGEKVQPQLLEAALFESTLVKAAVAFGEHQFEIGVLVQPARDLAHDEYDSFKTEHLWPVVESVREKMDEHARIQSPEAILIVPSTVALARTDKGSIARKEVYAMFEAKIALVYQRLESAGPVRLLRWDTLEQDLKELISGCVDWKGDWGFDEDFFERGMNSLQAIRVRRALVIAVTRSFEGVIRPERIGREFVYSYPSVRRMADFFRTNTKQTNGYSTPDAEGEVDAFVRKYVLDKENASTSDGQAVVLLTGATGSLGSHCLVSLLDSPLVERVICLVRPDNSTDAMSRLQKSLESKQLHLPKIQLSKTEVIECSTASDLLGLSPSQYASLTHSVTHILHMAWPVDFNWKLPSFHAQFQTLYNLLALGREIHQVRRHLRPRIAFISSIATVGRYARVHGGRIIPESPVDSVECLNPIGYAEAKLVCERILEHTRDNYPEALEISYIRVGQVAGSSTTGYWNVSEHFPALISSSRTIGAFPELQSTLSWIPVDLAAATINEILLSPAPLDLIYHLENPIRQPWHELLQFLSAELDISQSLPMDQWLDRVWNAPIENNNPAKKLYNFFANDFVRMACGEVVMGTENTRRVSATLRGMDAVLPKMVEGYVAYWRDVGMLK
ncbi:NRPS-like enzyme [Aspergillus ustus]|uniref:NRPS-like enzyme n=1 Tax=Aspergillus ustus TaxID=40382 RepID=A0A0C1BUV4_ASPUT|nr:NRPS-like enzyme [Aspergillus ustus]